MLREILPKKMLNQVNSDVSNSSDAISTQDETLSYWLPTAPHRDDFQAIAEWPMPVSSQSPHSTYSSRSIEHRNHHFLNHWPPTQA